MKRKSIRNHKSSTNFALLNDWQPKEWVGLPSPPSIGLGSSEVSEQTYYRWKKLYGGADEVPLEGIRNLYKDSESWKERTRN